MDEVEDITRHERRAVKQWRLRQQIENEFIESHNLTYQCYD